MAKWHIEGYRKLNFTENDLQEQTMAKVIECDYNPKATARKTLKEIFYENNLDKIVINNLHEGDENPYLLNMSDIDTYDVVFFELSNPYYIGDECNVMEFGYQYPQEKIHIIETIKMAIRCGLRIKFHSQNPKADTWVHEYYDYYRS